MLEIIFKEDTFKNTLRKIIVRELNKKNTGERNDYSEGGNENSLRDTGKDIWFQTVPKKNKYTA